MAGRLRRVPLKGRPRLPRRLQARLSDGRFGSAYTASARLAGPLLRRVGRVTGTVSTLGWSVLLIAVLGWVGSVKLGWVEAFYVAAAASIMAVVCALLTIGRTVVRVEVEVDPDRVVVGQPAAGRVSVTNTSRAPLLPVTLELPVGTQTARFELPALTSGAEHDEVFVIPTSRRGVIPIGPATTVRGDPFGLFGRSVAWTDVHPLYVHPRTVPLESVGIGLLRDLEGQTTNDMSMSDLAFHALRDYVPGDDRRFIHWRSSAKVGGGTPGGRFLVRQFLDSRRSHISVVVDSRLSSYADEQAVETAISAAASIALRAALDGIDTTVVAGGQVSRSAAARNVLDVFAMAEVDLVDLGTAALTCSRAAPDTSMSILVTGAKPGFDEVQMASSQFPSEAVGVVLRVDPGATRGGGTAGLLTLLQIATLDDLPVLLGGQR